MSNNRALAREMALKYLYHLTLPVNKAFHNELVEAADKHEFIDQDLNSFLESYQASDLEHPDNILKDEHIHYGIKIITGIYNNYETIEQIIEKSLHRWELSKIEKLDHCLLMIGAYELSIEKVPKSIVINELVTLAKKYSSEKSFSFINGVLDAIPTS